MYSNINHQNVQQEQTNHNILFTFANNKLQLISDLEDPNKDDVWKSTNVHEGELVIVYKASVENNALRPRIFYVLYVGSNDDGNGYLIYKLSMDQILVTIKYQSIPVPGDLIETMNETDSSDNKIQIKHFNNNIEE